MKNNKNSGKIKAVLQKLYWLPPLLLVAIVFILVFSLQGVKGATDTIKGWFNPDAKPKQCERIDVEEIEDIVTGKVMAKGEDVYFVYYYQKNSKDEVQLAANTNEVTYAANHALNAEIKAYNNDLEKDERITVYGVNCTVKERSTVDPDIVTDFKDSTMTNDTYVAIGEQVRLYLSEHFPSEVTAGENQYVLVTPTLARYTYNAEAGKYEVENVLMGDATSVSTYFNAKNIGQFFDGTYERA